MLLCVEWINTLTPHTNVKKKQKVYFLLSHHTRLIVVDRMINSRREKPYEKKYIYYRGIKKAVRRWEANFFFIFYITIKIIAFLKGFTSYEWLFQMTIFIWCESHIFFSLRLRQTTTMNVFIANTTIIWIEKENKMNVWLCASERATLT